MLQRPVAAATRERACRHLLDWLACSFAGSVSPEGVSLHRWAARFAASGDYPTVAGPTRSREAAILVNGGLGNILEMDDLHRTAILHPGPVVIPAVLVAAQASGASGEQVLNAIVRGYEAMIRIGQSFGREHYRFWHNTATAGPFGAAAAVCSLLDADTDAVVHALGHAGTQSAGLWQTRLEPSMSKQLHTGRAAHSGLVAAELAISGFTAPREILEGNQGFYAAMCPDPVPELVVAQADADWLIHEVSFKPWPACRHAHAAIDAALMAGAELSVDSIEKVTVRTYDEAIRFCDQPRPESVIEAKFSLQHAVAVCLIRGKPALADFEAPVFGDPAIRALSQRVEVELDPAINSRFPHRYGASIAVELSGGSIRQFESPDALGDPAKPVTEQQIMDKAAALLAWGGVSSGQADILCQVVSDLPAAPSIESLCTAISSAANTNK